MLNVKAPFHYPAALVVRGPGLSTVECHPHCPGCVAGIPKRIGEFTVAVSKN